MLSLLIFEKLGIITDSLSKICLIRSNSRLNKLGRLLLLLLLIAFIKMREIDFPDECMSLQGLRVCLCLTLFNCQVDFF